jgi:anaerobic selenocysteine-containing dehydrogenase
MCACRCGIRVHLQNGEIRYIDGNPDHPVNRGVICAKGSAGIMHHHSPARLTTPLKRIGERGSGEFQAIGWDEALGIATKWLREIRATDPRKLAFFTGRDQSQALTGWWAQQFGTPNYAAHGGFCSVNMAAAGLYTMGSSFWEFGEPDWDRTEYFMLFGVAEDHSSNPIKIGLGKLKARGVKVVSVNPVRTGYSAIADEWLGIRPGTDGLLVMSFIHELLRAGKVDAAYLARCTNAGWLVVEAPGQADDGLFLRDADGRAMVWDRARQCGATTQDSAAQPALRGRYTVEGKTVVPVFHLLAERYLDPQYAPESVAAQTGIAAETIRRIAAELARTAFEREVVIEQPWTDAFGRRHAHMVGRPVSMHAMRGISAHANGFHTCRALHLLQLLLGSVDAPGGFRSKPPYPKSPATLPKSCGRNGDVRPNTPLPAPHLGFPLGPEDLLVEPDGTASRIDKAFSWEAPLAIHGAMHNVIGNAWCGDPYPIDTLFLYMANVAWNSAMNTAETVRMLADRDPASGAYRIPRIIYSDAFYSETVAYADVVLPDTTFLERWDCISLLDRPISDADGPADAIRQPVHAPERNVRPFQDVLIDLGTRLGFPALVDQHGASKYPGGYADYIVNHERKPGVGPLAGWRGRDGELEGKGPSNPEQLTAYIANGCFWRAEMPAEARFFKGVNRAYLEYAAAMGFIDAPEPVIAQLYCEPLQKLKLAALGHGTIQPPEQLRSRVQAYCDPLPIWYVQADGDDSPHRLHAITQRPMAIYHSWGSHNAWLRQLHARNHLFLPRVWAEANGITDNDWVWVTSRAGRVRVPVKLMDGVNGNTVWTWNAIGRRAGAWNLAPDAPEVRQGFLLNDLVDSILPERSSRNRFSNSDPVTGQAAWYDLRVSIEKAAPHEAGEIAPRPPALGRPADFAPPPRESRYGAQFRSARNP